MPSEESLDTRTTAEKRGLGLGLGAVLAALGVSLGWLCCLPLALAGLGAGAAALGPALAPFRPLLSAAALALLGAAFYSAYRKPPCRPGEACSVTLGGRGRQLALWVIAGITVALLTVERWASWVIYWML